MQSQTDSMGNEESTETGADQPAPSARLDLPVPQLPTDPALAAPPPPPETTETRDLALQAQTLALSHAEADLSFFWNRSRALAAGFASDVLIDRMYLFHASHTQKEIGQKQASLEAHGSKNRVFEDMATIRDRLAFPQQLIRQASNFVPEHAAILGGNEPPWRRLKELQEEILGMEQEAQQLEDEIAQLKAEHRLRKRQKMDSE
jgi:hypothetical protein